MQFLINLEKTVKPLKEKLDKKAVLKKCYFLKSMNSNNGLIYGRRMHGN